jgi:hypothetical protein
MINNNNNNNNYSPTNIFAKQPHNTLLCCLSRLSPNQNYYNNNELLTESNEPKTKKVQMKRRKIQTDGHKSTNNNSKQFKYYKISKQISSDNNTTSSNNDDLNQFISRYNNCKKSKTISIDAHSNFMNKYNQRQAYIKELNSIISTRVAQSRNNLNSLDKTKTKQNLITGKVLKGNDSIYSNISQRSRPFNNTEKRYFTLWNEKQNDINNLNSFFKITSANKDQTNDTKVPHSPAPSLFHTTTPIPSTLPRMMDTQSFVPETPLTSIITSSLEIKKASLLTKLPPVIVTNRIKSSKLKQDNLLNENISESMDKIHLYQNEEEKNGLKRIDIYIS